MFCRQMDSLGELLLVSTLVLLSLKLITQWRAPLCSIFFTQLFGLITATVARYCLTSSMTGSIRGRETEMLPRNCHIFSSWSMMMVVGRVINTAGPLCLLLPIYLSLLLFLEVTSALGQTHPHHVAVEDLGREQSCSHPALQREITWSAGGIYK